MSVTIQPQQNGSVGLPNLNDVFNGKIDYHVADNPMVVWDKGVFLNELQKQGIVLSTDNSGAVNGGIVADTRLKTGTYKGTQLAMTEAYSLLEEAAVSQFHINGSEPIIPIRRDLNQKQEKYPWSDQSDGYPPHLRIDALPTTTKTTEPILNKQKSDDVQNVSMLEYLLPAQVDHNGTPYIGPTLSDCQNYNLEHPSPNTDIMNGQNIGTNDDWFSDARFAQQHFSGVNPTTIETAQTDKLKDYVQEAGRQGLDRMKTLLSGGKDMFIQDYSYFRKALGVKDNATFKNIFKFKNEKGIEKDESRFACASVVVFQLQTDGRLHPLAITLDHKGTLEKSITIFNRRLTPDNKGDEKNDWPWRYAKTCAQTADWARHQVAVHLVDTHLIEEAIIVATNRTIPEDHLIYEILSPHWFRTLPLNAAARTLLVPAVIKRLAGFAESDVSKLIDWSYKNFNFQEKYIPNDLKKRGFDVVDSGGNVREKYRNYPYATNMRILWGVLRDFVKSVLGTQYKSDKDVKDDSHIADWYQEIQTKAQITTFPTISTMDQLIDAVTMCIHIASPQHTAVNYLQNYYYSFVPAKPPALCTPLPKDLQTLQAYGEKDLTAALPIGTEDQKWKDWLLAELLPQLLSYKVDTKYNLITYAMSVYNVNKERTKSENQKFNSTAIRDVAAIFYDQLKKAEEAFSKISTNQTKGSIEYKVLQPETTAVSILI